MGKNKKNKNVFVINNDNDTNTNINTENDIDDWTSHNSQQNKNKKKTNINTNTFALLIDDDIEEQPKSEPEPEQVIKEINTEQSKSEPEQVIKETTSTIKDANNITKQEAFCLAYSYDLSGNYLDAINYYKIADKLGSKSASGNLAILLDENNLPEADVYYKKAIRNGNIGSLYDYAEYLIGRVNGETNGVNGKTNAELALKYFTYYKMMKNSDSDDKILWKKIIKNIL